MWTNHFFKIDHIFCHYWILLQHLINWNATIWSLLTVGEADAVYACEVSCFFTLVFGQTILEDLERERESSHLSRCSMRLSGKHSYSVSIAMVTRGPEQGMLGVAGKPLWCLVSRVLTKHIRHIRNSDLSPVETSPQILWWSNALFF